MTTVESVKNDISTEAAMKAIVGILLVNLVVRLWGIWNVTSTDEYIEVIEALRVGAGQLNLERWIKRVYLYILSVEFGVYYAVGHLLGKFTSSMDFATQVARNLEPLFLLARGTSALLGTATVWLTFLVGKHIHSRLAGVLAAILLTVTPVVLEMSHYARVDATLGFLVAAGMYFILRVYQETVPKALSYFLVGLFTGFAFQCKLQGILLVVPFATAVLARLWHQPDQGPVRQSLFSRAILFYPIGGLSGWVLGNPAVLIAFPKYVQALLSFKAVYTEPLNLYTSEHIGYVYYIYDFARNAGIPLFILTILSLGACAVWRPTTEKILLATLIVALYFVLGASKYLVSSSYLLPIYPFIYILVSVFILEGINSFSFFQRRLKPVTILLVGCALILQPAERSLRYLFSVSGPNTRVLAKEWIEINIPPHSRILMDSGRSLNTFAPLIAEDEASLRRMIESTVADIESESVRKFSGLVNRQGLILYELLLETVPQVAYDITSTKRGTELRDLDYYCREGFEYLIVSEEVRNSILSEEGQRLFPASAAFYQAAKQELHLMKIIAPTKFNSGDTFFIYYFDPQAIPDRQRRLNP